MSRTEDDRQLMLRVCRRHDRQAFTELVHRWDRRILAFLTKATGDTHAAEDLRQEVFLRVFRYGHTYTAKRPFPNWLYAIAYNVLSTWQRRQRRTMAVETQIERDLADSALTPCECATRNERDERLRSAIARLEPMERQLLLLRFDLDLSYREIAEMQGAPETTVKSRMYKLLDKLRQSLGKQKASAITPNQ